MSMLWDAKKILCIKYQKIKDINDARHEKTDLKVFVVVVVIPKEGWAQPPHPSFFWYDTDFSEFDSADIIGYIL